MSNLSLNQRINNLENGGGGGGMTQAQVQDLINVEAATRILKDSELQNSIDAINTGWNSNNLFIARNTNVNNMGNVLTYHVQMGSLVKSSPHITLNSGIISVNSDGWYKLSYNGLIEQQKGNYTNRMSIRMGIICIQDNNNVDDNVFWAACYLRGNNGTGDGDLTRYGYINNSGTTFLSANKSYRLIVQGALGGGDYNNTGLNNVYLRNANLQIERL